MLKLYAVSQKIAIAVVVAVTNIGCGSLPTKVDQALSNCESIRSEIIELSEKDRASRGYALVAIYEPLEVSKSENMLNCQGKASWSDSDTTQIKYKQYIDSEGVIMLEYDPF